MDELKKEDLKRAYNIIQDEVEDAREKYGDAAVRLTRLIEVANTLRNMLDS